MSLIEKMDRSLSLMQELAALLKEVHDELYAMDTGAADNVASGFDAAYGDIEFALENLPDVVAQGKRLRGVQ